MKVTYINFRKTRNYKVVQIGMTHNHTLQK